MKRNTLPTSLFLLCFFFFLSSCEVLNLSNSLNGWYTDLTGVATTSGFDRINQAITNHECIYTTGYSHNYDYYATPDLFFDSDGRWNSSDAHYGTCRFLPNGYFINVYRVLNQNTIVYYYCWLWKPECIPGAEDIAGRVYAGPYFQTLVYYDTDPKYHTFTKSNNKLIVANGDIFTITDGGLIKEGDSRKLSKYNPEKSF